MNLSEEALSIQTEDNTPYERPFKGDNNPTYPYDLKELSEANGGFDILKGTPVGNTLVVDFAIAAIAGEGLGRDAYTDLLAVSFSSTDYVGHQLACTPGKPWTPMFASTNNSPDSSVRWIKRSVLDSGCAGSPPTTAQRPCRHWRKTRNSGRLLATRQPHRRRQGGPDCRVW